MGKEVFNALVARIVDKPLSMEHIIDKFYNDNGIIELDKLSLLLIGADFAGQKETLKYVETKIGTIKKKEALLDEQLELDVISKRRQRKFFYPILICGFIAGLISILSEMNLIQLPKFGKENIKDTIIVLKQPKINDSITKTNK